MKEKKDDLISKWDKVKDLLNKNNVEAFLFSSWANVYYLTGLKASQAYFLVTKEKNFLITDLRYFERAKSLANPYVELKALVGDASQFLKNLFSSLNLKSIAFEKDRVACEFKDKLKSKNYKLIGISQPLSKIRMLKDEFERGKIKEAVKITDRIYLELLNFIQPGLSELEVRGKIVERAFHFLAEGEAFPSIVAFSEHSAIPHWESSKKKIQAKGPLLIDMGVIYEGYCSDFTRTVYLGKAPKEFKLAYSMVRDAWLKAFDRVKVGVPVYEIDKAVREYFANMGVLSFYTHATGHGLGIEIHEYPRLYYTENKHYLKECPKIEEGMVFTIEPGLYFSGKFGIRLENVVFVEKGEAKIYSEIPFDLVEL